MTNNKARQVNNPIIKQLLDETTTEELAKIDTAMTNNKQQTAVEWLFSETLGITLQLANKRISHRNWELQMVKLYEQAKEMDKEMTIKLYADYENYLEEAFKNQCGGQAVVLSFQEFYEQTYGGGEQ
jgi:hypothetical protein